MSEGFDNYGLRVKIIADYQYDDGRRVGQYKQVVFDPGVEEILESVLQLVEGCYGWGISRLDLIEKIKEELDTLGLEFKPGRIKKPPSYAGLDEYDPMVFRSTP